MLPASLIAGCSPDTPTALYNASGQEVLISFTGKGCGGIAMPIPAGQSRRIACWFDRLDSAQMRFIGGRSCQIDRAAIVNAARRDPAWDKVVIVTNRSRRRVIEITPTLCDLGTPLT